MLVKVHIWNIAWIMMSIRFLSTISRFILSLILDVRGIWSTNQAVPKSHVKQYREVLNKPPAPDPFEKYRPAK
jgi:hypothetical protein